MTSPTATTAPSHLEQRSLLFLQYQDRLRAFIYSLVRDPADAEDLLQEVGVFVLAKGDGAPLDAREFALWCRTVARHRVQHHWRARSRRRCVPSEHLVALVDQAYAEAGDDEDELAEQRRALAVCIEQVGEPARTMLRFRYVDGLDSDTIGAKMARSAASIRMALMRARKLLERCLERRLGAVVGGAR